MLSDVVFSSLGALLCSSTIVYYIKRKRKAEDFYLVVITTALLNLLCLMLIFWTVQDMIAIKNGDFETESGNCNNTKFETSGRSHIEEIHIELNGKMIFGNFAEFDSVRLGDYPCKLEYIEQTMSLYSIEELSADD